MDEMLVRDPRGGGNQSGLRDHNARLVLSYIRRHGAMASAEIARRSGLSAQTVSVIVRALEADSLLLRGEAVKGRVGKPSVPMKLNPKGAYSLGLSIGRRSLELVLVDFTGEQIASETASHRYPKTIDVFSFVQRGVPKLLDRAGVSRDRLAGLGVARPNHIWNWLEFMGAPDGALQDWRDLELDADIARITDLPVYLENDATSACVAEHLLGHGHHLRDFAYIFLGTFVGGGLVLDSKVISGRTNNMAAFGPLPVPDGAGGVVQLLDVASLHVLEAALEAAGQDSAPLRDPANLWDGLGAPLDQWLDATSRHLAIACASITSVVEVEAILIDGAFPAWVREALTTRVASEFSQLDITGIQRPDIREALIGRRARSIGAALLPIHAKFFLA